MCFEWRQHHAQKRSYIIQIGVSKNPSSLSWNKHGPTSGGVDQRRLHMWALVPRSITKNAKRPRTSVWTLLSAQCNCRAAQTQQCLSVNAHNSVGYMCWLQNTPLFHPFSLKGWKSLTNPHLAVVWLHSGHCRRQNWIYRFVFIGLLLWLFLAWSQWMQ